MVENIMLRAQIMEKTELQTEVAGVVELPAEAGIRAEQAVQA